MSDDNHDFGNISISVIESDLDKMIESAAFIQDQNIFTEAMLALAYKVAYGDQPYDAGKISNKNRDNVKKFYHYLEKRFMRKNNHYKFLTERSKEDFKRFVKNYAIYEVYKMQNPKRIAGETRFDNFTNNIISRGIDTAMRHSGGRKYEVKGNLKKLLGKVSAMKPGRFASAVKAKVQKAKGRFRSISKDPPGF